MWQCDCCVGQIPIRPPTEGLGMCALKLPPPRTRDVNLWCCSKYTISHISALACWAAAPPPWNMVISQKCNLAEPRKTNYKQHSGALQFYHNYLDSVPHLLSQGSIFLLNMKISHLLAQKQCSASFQKKPQGCMQSRWGLIEISFQNITKKMLGSNWIFLMR